MFSDTCTKIQNISYLEVAKWRGRVRASLGFDKKKLTEISAKLTTAPCNAKPGVCPPASKNKKKEEAAQCAYLVKQPAALEELYYLVKALAVPDQHISLSNCCQYLVEVDFIFLDPGRS